MHGLFLSFGLKEFPSYVLYGNCYISTFIFIGQLNELLRSIEESVHMRFPLITKLQVSCMATAQVNVTAALQRMLVELG